MRDQGGALVNKAKSILDQLQDRLTDPARTRESKGYRFLELAEAVECADGLRMSVQASRTHYCTPREDTGPWLCVEVDFPTSCVEALMPYAESPDDPTGTVYGYVPIEIVASVIEAHGGFKAESQS